MKCITCKKKIIVDKDTKQPYGAVSVITLPTSTSKHGKKDKEITVKAPISWANVNTQPLYGFICDDCYNPRYAKDYNAFIGRI